MNHVDDDNFLVYAAKHYDNPSCSTWTEFLDDVNKIKFIVKMFRRYERDGFINERLVLNHIILLYNVFERDAITQMLAHKCRNHLPFLKPFLILLNFWPERLGGIIGSDISMDTELVERLRKI